MKLLSRLAIVSPISCVVLSGVNTRRRRNFEFMSGRGEGLFSGVHSLGGPKILVLSYSYGDHVRGLRLGPRCMIICSSGDVDFGVSSCMIPIPPLDTVWWSFISLRAGRRRDRLGVAGSGSSFIIKLVFCMNAQAQTAVKGGLITI